MTFAFAGTPEFGAWVLDHLLDLGRTPVLVISQPDRPAGRGRIQHRPRWSRAPQQPVWNGCRRPTSTATTCAIVWRPPVRESLVVAAFGQLLKAPLLATLPCINVHASLLPAYRGAAPLNRALMAGEDETGVCIMRWSPASTKVRSPSCAGSRSDDETTPAASDAPSPFWGRKAWHRCSTGCRTAT